MRGRGSGSDSGPTQHHSFSRLWMPNSPAPSPSSHRHFPPPPTYNITHHTPSTHSLPISAAAPTSSAHPGCVCTQFIPPGAKDSGVESSAMALRSAAAQAATLLRLTSRPAVTQSLWVPLARRFSSTQFASDEVRPGLHYADTHEWVKVEGDIGIIGITDHAQKELGDLVFVELPDGGSSVTAAEKFGSVESVKAVSDINSPVSGEVLEFNSVLGDNPETINSDPYEGGWLIKVKLSDKSEVEKLKNHEEYAEFQLSDHH